MKTILLAIFVLTSNLIIAQSVRERNAVLIPQGYGIEQLNSDGSSGIVNDVSNISSMNPASIFKLENLSFGFSYQFQSILDDAWIAGIGTSRIQNYIPQSIGGIIHYENFSFGIGFNQKYNGSLDISPIEVTTVSNPDGTGEYYTPVFENTLQNYTISSAYLFEGILGESSSLAFGFNYILNRLYSYESLAEISANANAFGSNFELGAYYEINFNEEQYLGIGSSYTFSTEVSDQLEYENTRTLIPGDSSFYQIATPDFYLSLTVPSEFSIDINFKPVKQLNLLGRINTIFWNTASENVKDQIEFSTSAAYSFNPSLEASLGFYYTSKEYLDDFFNINDDLYAIYLTTGASFQLNIFNIDLAIADSHLFSGEFWKQTIGKIGFGIQL